MDFFHFVRPVFLLLIPVVIYIWWQNKNNQTAHSIWNNVCDTALTKALLVENSGGNQLSNRNNLFFIIGLLSILALSGPAWDKDPNPLLRNKNALLIAFDLSNSMLVRDVKPARYVRARFKIEDLLNNYQKGNVALIAYAANAYAVTPLTHDVETLKSLVPALTPKIMPGRGSNVYAALQLSKELLKRSELDSGDIVLVTDGIGSNNIDELISFAKQANLRVSILGVGTEIGANIPEMNDIDFIKNSTGELIQSRLESESLSSLAQGTDGKYIQSRSDIKDINELIKHLLNVNNEHQDSDELGDSHWNDKGFWISLLCLAFMALLFRKNAIFIVLIAISLSPHKEVIAAESNNLFLNKNQQGKQAFDRKDFQTAEKLFSDIRWQAATAYRLNNWETALDLYKQLNDVESIYNRGNTLVFLARLEEAVIAYNQVLKRNPQHEDALFNKSEVLRLLEKLSNENKDSSIQNKDKTNPKEKSNDSKQSDSENQENNPPNQPNQDNDSNQSSGNPDDIPIENTATKPSETDDANTAEVGEVEQDIAENNLAEEQWLRRIKDDPAGLMRRKFREQSRNKKNTYEGDPW